MSWRLAPYHQCTNPCLQQSSICSCPPEQLKHLLHFRASVQAHLRPKHLSDAVNLYMCASRLYSSCYAHLHLSVAADWCPHQVSLKLCAFTFSSCAPSHSTHMVAAVFVCIQHKLWQLCVFAGMHLFRVECLYSGHLSVAVHQPTRPPWATSSVTGCYFPCSFGPVHLQLAHEYASIALCVITHFGCVTLTSEVACA